MLRFYIDLLSKKRTLMLVYAILVAASLTQVLNLHFQHHRDRFFPADDKDLAFTHHFFKNLEQDDIYVLVGLELNKTVLDSAEMTQLASFTNACLKIPQVEQALSIANYREPKRVGLSVYPASFIRMDGRDSQRCLSRLQVR